MAGKGCQNALYMMLVPFQGFNLWQNFFHYMVSVWTWKFSRYMYAQAVPYDQPCLNLNNSKTGRSTPTIFSHIVQTNVPCNAQAWKTQHVAPVLGGVPVKTRLSKKVTILTEVIRVRNFLGDKIKKFQSTVFLRLFSLYMCAKLKADMTEGEWVQATEGEYRIALLLISPLYHVLRKQ